MLSLIAFRAGWPLAAAASFLPVLAHAQSAVPNGAVTSTVVITGNPLGSDTLAQPSSVITGEGLALRRAGTLGETLESVPGVSATAFGPNSSRPVIRGLDGDRLRLLDNGGASVDASSLSFDHASATDPLVAERIEVLRGPAALLYGGNAVGGVVNTIDNRIPRLGLSGLGGRAELRLGGAAHERAGAAVLEGGAGSLAWHVDAQARDAQDQRVPLYTPVAEGAALDPARRVRNSAARTNGGAVGASWVAGGDYAGVSVETARQHYGTTVEPDVAIQMKRDRIATAGRWGLSAGPLAEFTAQASHTDYEHQEIAGDGTVGTTFLSKGNEGRVQLRQRAVALAGGEWQGVLGAQAETLRFSALGEEAFVPGTNTRNAALFTLQEWRRGPWNLSAGARMEQVRVASDGDTDAANPRFGSAQSHSFKPASLAFALKVAPAAGWQLSLSTASTERAPTFYELYANGLHVATAAFEVGDTTLGRERSRHVEAGAAWRSSHAGFSVQLFRTGFSRYLWLDDTGTTVQVPGEAGDPPQDVPVYAFRAVRAQLSGGELEAHARLLQQAGFSLDLRASADLVRGTDQDSGQPLPRLAPWRARAALVLRAAQWQAGAEVRHSAAQNRVPATDTATAGFTMLDLWAGAALPVAGAPQLLVKLGNATNALGYSASTVATMRGLSPLPGRALSVVLRAAF
jgi:iron complex outermembrane receptor protein